MNEPQRPAIPTSQHSGIGNEELSRRNKDQLDLALSSARTGTWDWYLLDRSMQWDERMHALFGLAPSTFGGRYEQFLEMIHGENRQQVTREFAQAVERRAEYDGVFRAVWPTDGSVHTLRARSKVVCDNQGKPVLVTGVSWDVSERSQMENALARERFLLNMLMDTLPDRIYFKDRESRFIAVNRATAAVLGLENPADVLGKTDADLFAREHAQAALRDEQEILRTGQPLVNREEKETWPDGHETWVSTSKLPLRDPNGRIIGTFGLSRDITEKKRAAEKLAALTGELGEKNEAMREAQAALTHVSRVTTVGELAASIAHELTQPLAGVVTNSNACLRWLDSAPPNFEEGRQAVMRILRDGKRATEVIARIRTLLGQTRTEMVPVDINKAIQEVVAFVQAELKKNGVKLRLNLDPALPVIDGDRVQLQQVILNLLINAIEAMGSIDRDDRELQVASERQERASILVAVRDSGPGLGQQSFEEISKPFFTTKPHGMGMGLSISRSIVRNHGGRLWAEPNVDRGAKFQFTLPVRNG